MRSTVIVTGSAGTIGKAIAAELGNAGFYIVGLDREPTESQCDKNILLDIADATRTDSSVEDAFRILDEALNGRPFAGLVNNAAIQHVCEFDSLSRLQIDESFRTNVVAPMLLSQFSCRRFSASTGTIVNIGSIHSRLTKPGFTAYASSKGALESFTKALAVEVGKMVKVVGIAPAAIDTSMLRAGFEADNSRLADLGAVHPTGSIGDPREVAKLVAFLMRNEIPFINGAIIDLSGGISSRLHDPI